MSIVCDCFLHQPQAQPGGDLKNTASVRWMCALNPASCAAAELHSCSCLRLLSCSGTLPLGWCWPSTIPSQAIHAGDLVPSVVL
mmetsp:Transcript_89505/g.227654  ORF Transcript_89505/g.227654 Transcript_89505/m.227654 type:complete len:84 (-) Transcript_89505:225-476(-)